MAHRRLVFVYKTDANPVSLVSEFAREVLLEDGYQCSLCHLTYKGVLKRSDWKRFVDDLPLPSTFHLRSNFLRKHGELADHAFPSVFIEDDAGVLHELLDAQELRSCNTVADLMSEITHKLDVFLGPRTPSPDRAREESAAESPNPPGGN